MKRTLVIVVLAVLLLSTVATAAAVAKDNQPAGNSDIYQYGKDIDPAGHGKLIVNTKQLTYAFEARKCEPGMMYYLHYTDDGKRVDIGSATADMYGNLVIAGAYGTGTDVTLDQLIAAEVTTTPPVEPLEAIIVVTESALDPYTSSNTIWLWLVEYQTGGDVVSGYWEFWYNYGAGDIYQGSFPIDQMSYPIERLLEVDDPVFTETLRLTVVDANSNTASVSLTFNGGTQLPAVGEYSSLDP